jgi:drug/metabolite transporter (DMT)-like permease
MATSPFRNNLVGIASLSAGTLVFSLQDTVIKAISGEHSVTLAIVLRAVVAFPILTVMVIMAGGLRQLETPHWPMLLGRGFILLTAYTTYFMAFPALPLAEAIALYFMVPLLVTLMSGPLLGERVSPSAWGAVVLGLIGVIVILRPGYGIFEPAALLSLVSAATYAYAMILARKHGRNVAAPVMTFYLNFAYLIGAITIATITMALQIAPPGHPSLDFLVRPWSVPNLRDMGLMALCGIIAAFGSNFLAQGYRKGAAYIVAPFEYLGMVWGSLWGFLFFSEVPRITTFVGMGLIALAGLLALRAGAKQA